MASGLEDVPHRFGLLLGRELPPLQELSEPEHRGQGGPQLVAHPRQELGLGQVRPCRLLAHPAERLLGHLPLSDVEHQPLVPGRLASRILDDHHVDRHPDLRSVDPLPLHLEVPGGAIGLEPAQELLLFRSAPEGRELLPLREELLRGVEPHQAGEGRVHRRGLVVQGGVEHTLVRVLEDQAVGVLGLLQRPLDGQPLGHVPGNGGSPDDVAGSVAYGRHGDRDVDGRAVLGQTHRLKARDVLT